MKELKAYSHSQLSKIDEIVNTRMKEYHSIKQTVNFKLEVLVSSAKANSSIVNDYIMIDHGLKSKDMMNLLKKRKYLKKKFHLFITHSHSDHFNPGSIIRNIALDNNFDKVYCTKDQYDDLINIANGYMDGSIEDDSYGRIPHALKNLKHFDELYEKFEIIDENSIIRISKNNNFVNIRPIKVKHSIDNFAYLIQDDRSKSFMIYATDLSSTDDLPDIEYELIALENSWSDALYGNTLPHSFRDALKYHLTSEDCRAFIKNNLAEEGLYEELHTSNYTVTINELDEMLQQRISKRKC